MTIKRLLFLILPISIQVSIFKKYRLNTPCGYGERFSVYLEKAFATFLTEDERSNPEYLHNLTNDIIKSWILYRALPYEYFLYQFKDKTHNERSEFITDSIRLQCLAKIISVSEFSETINNKYNFYLKFRSFFKRNAMLVKDNGCERDFIEFALREKKLFVKLLSGNRGTSAKYKEITSEADALSFYNELTSTGEQWIAETKIEQSSVMSQWCSTCVNTVRVPSFIKSNGIVVLDPFFRTGHEGSIVDNAGQGGIFSVVDPESGILITDGVDEDGNQYVTHPNSNLKFKGWQVPQWKELLHNVEEAHKQIPSQKYIGWDFALTDNGWVLIEGNWGQMLGQIATKKGIKKDFYNLLRS